MSRGIYAVFFKPNTHITQIDCDDLPEIYKGDVEWKDGISYSEFCKKVLAIAGAKGEFLVTPGADNLYIFTSIDKGGNLGFHCLSAWKRRKPTKSKIPVFNYSFFARCKPPIE